MSRAVFYLLKLLVCGLFWASVVSSSGQDPDHSEPDPIPPPVELDLTEISIGMDSDDFKAREEATLRLVELSRNQLPAVSSALFALMRESKDPEVRFRCQSAFKRVFDFRVLGKGDANLGVTWHWHIQLGLEGEMRARPLVRKIAAGSPAAEAGLKVGDIVCYVNGKELPRQQGMPVLRKTLREAKAGDQLVFTVRSVKLLDRRFTTKPEPNRKVTITVQDTKKGLRAAKPGEYQKWFAGIRKLYDRSGA